MTLLERYAREMPGAFFLDASQPAALQAYLLARGVLAPGRSIHQLERAGEGNMNLVLRATLDDGGTLIIKQSRPWAEKFPSVAAPAERADSEAEFYRRTAPLPPVAACSPRLRMTDTQSHILVMDDLGPGRDLFSLYRGDELLDVSTLDALTDYLSALHRGLRQPGAGFTLPNRAMRALNAEHIFRFPFRADSGFDVDNVTPGLRALAAACRADALLMQNIAALEARYLADGNTLLHGDFFPGSFLRTEHGLKVIDPEFCFFGDAEFDLGVLIAHLRLARQPESLIARLLARYAGAPDLSEARCHQYAGIEVLRRLLGIAQLPLPLDLAAKRRLIDTARGYLSGA